MFTAIGRLCWGGVVTASLGALLLVGGCQSHRAASGQESAPVPQVSRGLGSVSLGAGDDLGYRLFSQGKMHAPTEDIGLVAVDSPAY